MPKIKVSVISVLKTVNIDNIWAIGLKKIMWHINLINIIIHRDKFIFIKCTTVFSTLIGENL